MSTPNARSALRSYLLADSAIAAEIDSGASVVPRYRMFSGRMPQGEIRKSIVYTLISAVGDHHMAGPSGLGRFRIQIDSWAQTLDAAVALSNLVKERIDGFRGSIQWDDNSPGNSVTVQGLFFDGSRDLYDETAKLHRVSQDYFVAYDER